MSRTNRSNIKHTKWRAFKKVDSKWIPISFQQIKKGDIIKMIDEDGEIIEHIDGRSEFVAKSDAYLDCIGMMCFDI